ncbi:MAG: hypothetical protein KKA19_08565 [Candidatus Margulisbacteria bacterium]|nr:hypothetical protein [Candidatus Margulisiibacteriota bacterium]
MSYRKIISTNNKHIITKEDFKNVLFKLLAGTKVPPFTCTLTTNNWGLISFQKNNQQCTLSTGQKGQQIIKIESIHTKAYGPILRLKSNQGEILNDYQVHPKLKALEKGYELYTFIDYHTGLNIDPVAFSRNTDNHGFITLCYNEKSYTFSTGLNSKQIVNIEPIQTKAYGIILRFTDKNRNFLCDYQLRPFLKKFDRGYEFQTIIDHISDSTIQPIACTLCTNKKRNISFRINNKEYAFSTNLKNQLINIEPIQTNVYGWVLRLKNKEGEFICDYQLKLSLRHFARGYKIQTISDHIFGLDITPLACSIKTNNQGSITFKHNKKLLQITTGKKYQQIISIEPIQTKAYGWILRLKNNKGEFICDYQLRPSLKFLEKGYEFQTVSDYLNGLDVQPLPSSTITTDRGVINFFSHSNKKRICIHTGGEKNKTVLLIPKYNSNYGWLIEVWNENKTKLLTTIDRRRL